jgi:hypothetical protein
LTALILPFILVEGWRTTFRAPFQAWLPSVKRASDEERSVIPWIRRALQDHLALPGMRGMDKSGGEWLFLNQEWRFVRDDGGGRKSDILAVHRPSRRLGIVEVKDSRAKRGEAIAQVNEYGRYWQRDAEALAPFFTETLNVMGRLYGNEWASTAVVSEAPAALFFARKGFLAMEIERVG